MHNEHEYHAKVAQMTRVIDMVVSCGREDLRKEIRKEFDVSLTTPPSWADFSCIDRDGCSYRRFRRF